MESLCNSCANVRKVVSGTGSTFLLCQLSHTDGRFPKYPPQPVGRCDGYLERSNGGDDSVARDESRKQQEPPQSGAAAGALFPFGFAAA